MDDRKIGDSQLCLELLAVKFRKDFSSHLSSEQKSIARSFQIMAEDHLYWSDEINIQIYSNLIVKIIRAVLLWRWIDDKGRSLPLIQSQVHFAVRYLKPLVIKRIKSQAKAHGMGRHSPAQVVEMGMKDLRAVSAFLGT